MKTCYIGIGSNLGDRNRYIDSAIAFMKEDASIDVLRVSSIYETQAVGDVPQGAFLNGVIEIATSLSPRELLQVLLAIEERLGRRRRRVSGGPRQIDLDILLYGNEKIDEGTLTIPHPRMWSREFVLRGLRELGYESR